MPAHYEITRLAFRPNGVAPALPAIERGLSEDAPGKLAAVLIAEIGALNEVMIIHTVEDAAKAHAARAARVRNGNPFGVGDQLVGAWSTLYASFPSLPPMPAGRHGPVFEVREYTIKPQALGKLIDAWTSALPARLAMSPIVTAAYAVDGEFPRIFHVWPYADLNERTRMRADAVAKGVWPPKGGAEFIATMRSSIYLPAPFSPLQ